MHIHFIGIGGSAMGSVATACAAAGHTITGSDTAIYPPMSDVLQGAGVSWYDGYDAEKLRELAPNLVVVGNAVSRGNPEVEFTLNARLPMTSMAGLVGSLFISRNSSIVCAGTHGKTTTSAMTAWILDQAGMKPGFLIGGVPRGFTSGCRPVPESVHDTFGGVFVVEGDEYDTAFFDKRSKFVHYRPTTVIVNNIEFDHADIFDSLADIQWSFRQLIRIVPSDGRIFVNADDKVAMETVLNDHTPVVSVGLSENADRRIVLTDSNEHATTWHISQGRTSLGPFTLHMAGEHNVRNASMAILSSISAGVTMQEAALAIATFQPPKRRLEILGTWKGATVIDDFAHHPTAIRATIRALHTMYPQARIHSIFEPRSNTTSRSVFQTELETCFEGSASLCIGPVNRPERYSEAERLDTDALVVALQKQNIKTHALASDLSATSWGSDVLPWLETHVAEGDVIAILSNGNVGGLRRLLVSPTA